MTTLETNLIKLRQVVPLTVCLCKSKRTPHDVIPGVHATIKKITFENQKIGFNFELSNLEKGKDLLFMAQNLIREADLGHIRINFAKITDMLVYKAKSGNFLFIKDLLSDDILLGKQDIDPTALPPTVTIIQVPSAFNPPRKVTIQKSAPVVRCPILKTKEVLGKRERDGEFIIPKPPSKRVRFDLHAKVFCGLA